MRTGAEYRDALRNRAYDGSFHRFKTFFGSALMVGMNTGLEGMRRKHDTARFVKNVLPNGVTIWNQENSILVDEGIGIMGFLPNVGAQLDPRNKPGLAHFFEHMPFRGTKNLPSTEAIEEPIRERGGDLDGHTTDTRTEFTVSGLPSQDFELGLQTLAELMMVPLIREEDVAIEKRIVSQNEYVEAAADSERARGNAMVNELFKDHPRGHDVLGEPSIIEAMTAGQLLQFHKAHYHAGNFHLAFGGDTPDILTVYEMVNKYFGHLSQNLPTLNPEGPLPFDRSGTAQISGSSYGLDSISLVYPMRPGSESELDRLHFFAGMISGGITSPLGLELREKRGMAYETDQCSTLIYPDMWCFEATFVTPANNFRQVEEVFRETLIELGPALVLRRQKERQYARQSEFTHPVNTCSNVSNEITNFGYLTSHHEDEQTEDNLTLDQVFSVRDYLLETEPLTIEIRAG
jgi:predicted Zn-dependent peptidase